MEDLILPACAGIAVLVIVAGAAYVLLNRSPVSCRRRREGQNTCLTISAKRNIERIRIVASFDGEEVPFERKRIRKGQTVDFVFPFSESKVRISVSDESGASHELLA